MVYILKSIGIFVFECIYQHRIMIWRFLARLPENRESYESLLQQGLHPQLRDFRKKFPLKSDNMSKVMEK